MQYVVGFILLIIFGWMAIAIALKALALIITLAIFTAGALLIYGTVKGLYIPYSVFRRQSRGAGDIHVDIATPDKVAAGEVVRGAPPGGARNFGWDRAWPNYVPYQLTRDTTAVWSVAKSEASDLFRTYYLAPAAIGLLASVFLWWLITLVAKAAVTVGQRLTGWRMRRREARYLRTNGAEVHCPHCHRTTTMPSYRCPNPDCGIVHRDINPGELGIKRRICACGTSFPLTIAAASPVLTAVCPFCDEDLAGGSGSRRVVLLPVFGPVSAGKTLFLSAVTTAMIHRSNIQAGDGLSIRPLGHDSDEFSRVAYDDARAGRTPMKTPHSSLPLALPFLLQSPSENAELQLIDAAGEYFVNSDITESLTYFESSRVLVFVVDPLTLPLIAEKLAAHPKLSGTPVAQGSAEDSYASVVDRLRSSGVDMRSRNLAVIVTKSDIVAQLAPERPLPGDSDGIRDWLEDYGADSLTRSITIDVGTPRFFAVDSLHRGPNDATRLLEIVDWAIRSTGGSISLSTRT